MNDPAPAPTEKPPAFGIVESVDGVTDVVLAAMAGAPTGELLRAQRRHPYRPAHLHFPGFKPGYQTMITQVFADDDLHLESDVVFGVTRELIGLYVRHDADETPPAVDVEAPWYTLDYSFVMQPGEAKRPIPPIK